MPTSITRHACFALLTALATTILAVGCTSSNDPTDPGSTSIAGKPSADTDLDLNADMLSEEPLDRRAEETAEKHADETTEKPADETTEVAPRETIDVPEEETPKPSESDTSQPSPDAPSSQLKIKSNPLRPDVDNSPDGTHSTAPADKQVVPPGEDDEEPFDPIKENGPIFVDWPKPKLALLLSGRRDGYLEPCGCAGLDQMKGGLSRLDSLLKELREEKGWEVVAIDAGGLIKGYGRQAEMKFQTTVEAMRHMRFDAIALGTSDLKLPATELLTVTASTPGNPSLFLSANVGVFGFDDDYTAPMRLIEAAGIKVGVTSVLGSRWQKELNNPEIELADPNDKLAELLPALKEQADYLILAAHATVDESEELARRFPDFNLVITAGGPTEPPDRPKKVDGTDTLLIEIGQKGENVIVLGLYDDAETPYRYQRVPLDSRFGESKAMKLSMANYQDQLKRILTQEGLAGLGIRPVPHAQRESLGKFVGSKECESCHEESYDVWKKSGHADGWETLTGLDPPRDFDPECISCHVVGWHPTKYFPYESGFLSEEKTPELVDVGCENCHGPGELHVKAEMGADLKLQAKLAEAMVVTKEQARDSKVRWCLNCHDLDNSPDFDFDTYWPKIEHYEGPPEEREE